MMKEGRKVGAERKYEGRMEKFKGGKGVIRFIQRRKVKRELVRGHQKRGSPRKRTYGDTSRGKDQNASQ